MYSLHKSIKNYKNIIDILPKIVLKILFFDFYLKHSKKM